MKLKLTYIIPATILIMALISSCAKTSPLNGKWQYNGGLYNAKKQESSSDFKLQREYKENTYEGFMLEMPNPPEKFNSGTYQVKNDSLFITTNYNSLPSQLLGKTVKFKYQINGQKLILNGILPNGVVVEEYWERVN